MSFKYFSKNIFFCLLKKVTDNFKEKLSNELLFGFKALRELTSELLDVTDLALDQC